MAKTNFDIADSVFGKTRVCTQEELERQQASEQVKANCAGASKVFEDWTEETADEETVRLKKLAEPWKKALPVVMVQATYKDGVRHGESAVDSGLFSIDIDHVGDPDALWKSIAPRMDELKGVWWFKSPTGKGLKGVCMRPRNLSIAEAQAWLAMTLQLKEYDISTKDAARCCFLVPKEYNLLYRADLLFGERDDDYVVELSEDEKAKIADMVNGGKGKKVKGKQTAVAAVASGGKASVARLLQIKYNADAMFCGVPYQKIAYAFWEKLHGTIHEGIRHQCYLDWAKEAASICDYNAEKLMEVTPRLKDDEEELARVIADTLNWKAANFSPTMPYTLRKVLTELGVGKKNTDKAADRAIMEMNEYYLSRLPPLPAAMQAVLNGCERKYWMQVLIGMLPAWNTYLEKVVYRYGSGKIRRPSMMSLIVGEKASGKGTVTSQIEDLLRPMLTESHGVREKQDEVRDKNNAKADNQEGKTFSMFIKNPNMNITDAELLAQQKIATKHGCEVHGRWLARRQFMFSEEANVVKKMLRNDQLASAWCLNFDSGLWGKDVHADNAVSGQVYLAFDFTAMCTYNVMRYLLNGDNVENGTASRILIALMPSDHFAHQPMFHDKSKKDLKAINDGIARLQEAEGYIEAKRLGEAQVRWTNDLADWCEEHDDVDRDSARRRAGMKGSDAAILYALLEKPKCRNLKKLPISDNALKFFEVIAEYDVETQASLFANMKPEGIEVNISTARRVGKNHDLIDQLPDVFTRDDVKALKPDVSRQGISNVISRLKSEGVITEYEPLKYKKTNGNTGI